MLDKKKKCKIVDLSIPQGATVEQSSDEKFQKYQDLAREIKRIWQIKVQVTPPVVGTLGTIPRALKANLEEIVVDVGIDLLQKSVLLGSETILRKVLESLGY